jgi:thioredoxin reductase
MAEDYDVVVVGGGAAGLSGALALSRARRSVLVVDAGEPRNAPAGHVHNYLGREGTPPGELLAIGREEVAHYGGEVVSGVVRGVRRRDEPLGFEVQFDGGRVVAARRLLLTTGLVDELPDLAGLAQRWGRDVLHCPYCHGWEVRDQAIGVLATGPMSVHQALLFRQWSDDVVLLQHTAAPLSDEELEQLAARGIAVIAGEVDRLEVSDDRLRGVRLRSGKAVALQALVVAPFFRARAGLLAELGLEPVAMSRGAQVVATHIASDPTGATTVPGVWVAGNVADPFAQVVASAAAGLMAGAAINGDLVADDTARAVERTRAAAA